MNFELTDAQEMFVDAAKKLTHKRLAPVLQRYRPDCPLPKDAMLEIYGVLGKFGITAARLPVEHGGTGLSMIDYGLAIEQLPPVIALSLISHDGSITRLHAGAPAELLKTYLPDLIAGRKIICTATSEPESGSDSSAIRTKLEVEGPDAYITGRKLWITNASVCDLMIVACTVGFGDRDRPIATRVLVDRNRADLDIREISLTGLKQGHLGEVVFERTHVPSANIIGSPGDAGKYMTLAWNGNRPLLGMIAVGIAQRALDIAREYVGVRRQFGKNLGSHQLVQQDLADIETAVVSSRLMCLYALGCLDEGARANGTSAMAKRFATSNALKAVDLAMQLHGAMGIAEEFGLEQLWRDIRVLQVPDGTMGILALIHGRELTGTAAFR